MSKTATSIAIISALAACGDPEEIECRDPASQVPADGVLASPAELDQSSCNPDSIARKRLTGSYYNDWSKFRIHTCGFDRFELRGLGQTGSTETYLDRSDAGLFIRASTDSSVIGLLICGDNHDGTFHGVTAYCSPDQEGLMRCSSTYEQTLHPFDRVPGESERDGLELIAEIDETDGEPWDTSYVSNVEFAHGLVFLSLRGQGLHIFDAEDPTDLREVGFLPGEEINDIKAFSAGGRRYVALADLETPIVDVTVPSAPTIVSTLGGYTHRIEVDTSRDGTPRIWVRSNGSVLVFSLADPAAPKFKLTVPVTTNGGTIHALTVKDEMLYVASGQSGFHVIDPFSEHGPVTHGVFFDAPAYSHHAGIFTVGDRTYALHNDEVGSSPWFKTIDVTLDAESFLDVVSEYKTRDFIASHNVKMVGTRAYVAYYQDGVRVLDASDPTNLRLAAYFNTWNPTTAPHAFFEGAVDVDVDPDTATVYVADSPRGLLVLRETGVVPQRGPISHRNEASSWAPVREPLASSQSASVSRNSAAD